MTEKKGKDCYNSIAVINGKDLAEGTHPSIVIDGRELKLFKVIASERGYYSPIALVFDNKTRELFIHEIKKL